MADEHEIAALSEPRETEGEAPEPRKNIEKVSFDAADDALAEAAKKADDRDDLAIDYDDCLETCLTNLTDEDFEDLKGHHFEIDLGQSRVKLKLNDVERLGEAPDLDGDGAPDARAPFRLVFHGSSPRNNLTEGWYHLAHPAFHDFAVYLEPLEPPEGEEYDWPRLEAIFN